MSSLFKKIKMNEVAFFDEEGKLVDKKAVYDKLRTMRREVESDLAKAKYTVAYLEAELADIDEDLKDTGWSA